MPKQIISSFIVGGLFSVLAQAFFDLSTIILGTQSSLIVPMMLLFIGLTGGVLFIAGIYQKIEKVGYFGAILPLCGLVAALAGAFTNAQTDKDSLETGTKAALNLFLYVLGIGTVLSIIIGIISFYTV